MKEQNIDVFLVNNDEQKNLAHLLNLAIVKAKESLKYFFNTPNFFGLQSIFGAEFEIEQFAKDWQNNKYPFPEIEIVSRSQINNANGAFATETNKIYLAKEFLLANQNNLDAITNVLLEEYGHYLDRQLNLTDTLGDEGAIFAAVVQGEELSESELQQLRSEDDSAVVFLDGESRAIEQNESESIIRVSVASDGTQANNDSSEPSISANGRYVAFTSVANNLVSNDTNYGGEVFLHDIQTRNTERIALTSEGFESNGFSYDASVNADARYISFTSSDGNIVDGDYNGYNDIFLKDRQTKTIKRITSSYNGFQTNGDSEDSSISNSGRYIAFHSWADNLVDDDTNNASDIFVYDMEIGITERVSIDYNGFQTNSNSVNPSISSDGRYIVFSSLASDLVLNDTNNSWDTFIYDRQTGVNERINVTFDGFQSSGHIVASRPSISADGRYVTFNSSADNLVFGDNDGQEDTFIYDRQTKTNMLSEYQLNPYASSVSADGRYEAFRSGETNLVFDDTNDRYDIFVRDRGETFSNPENSIFTEDTNTLISTLGGDIGSVDSLGNFSQLTNGQRFYDIALSSDNKLYGITSGFSGKLYEVNLNLGEFSQVGYSGASLNALAFDDNDVLYGAGSSSFYRIDTNTGDASFVASLGSEYTSSGDLVFDNASDHFFATSLNGSTDTLYSISRSGEATEIGDIGFDNVWGLSIEGGNLIGYTADEERIAINKQTGVGTFDTSVTGIDGQISGAASIKGEISTDNSGNNSNDDENNYSNEGLRDIVPVDAVYEFLAKDVAYKNWKKGENLDEFYVDKWKEKVEDSTNFYQDVFGLAEGEFKLGYVVDKVFTSGYNNPNLGELYAIGLIPENPESGLAPVLTIRGSVEIPDWLQNADPIKGIGYVQYNARRNEIFEWVQNASKNVGGAYNNPKSLPIDITGHSLGGAISQLFAADFTSNNQNIGNLITFNSPGIESNLSIVKQSKPEYLNNATHYVTSSDLVSLGGDTFLPGKYVLSDYFSAIFEEVTGIGSAIQAPKKDLEAIKRSLEDTHLLPVLVNSTSVGSKTDDKWDKREKATGLKQQIFNSSNGLSDSFYTYFPDVDHFALQLLAAYVVSPGLAVALNYRGSTELVRQTIGGFLYNVLTLDDIYYAPRNLKIAYESAQQWVSYAWDAMTEFGEDAWSALTKFSESAWQATTQFSSDAWEASVDFGDYAWNGLVNFGEDVWDELVQLPGYAWDAMTQFPSYAWDTLTTLSESAWNAMTELADYAWDAMTEFGEEAWNALTNLADYAWDNLVELQDYAWDALTEYGEEAWTGLTQLGEEAWNEFAKSGQAVWQASIEWRREMWNGISNAKERAIDFISDASDKARDSINKNANDFWRAVNRSFDNLIGEANNLEIEYIGESISNTSNLSLPLEQAKQISKNYLSQLINNPDFTTIYDRAFGLNWNQHVAEQLKEQWSFNDFTNLPSIFIVSSSTLNNLNGIYETQNNEIYLSDDFILRNFDTPELIASVILEEIGHHIDYLINTEDSPGDEGEIFSALIRNETLTDEELEKLLNENDFVVIEQNDYVWDSLAEWSDEAWDASLEWSDEAWDAILNWSDSDWQETVGWTGEQWQETTSFTDEQWRETISSDESNDSDEPQTPEVIDEPQQPEADDEPEVEVIAEPQPDLLSIEVHRFYQYEKGFHLYTADPTEINYVKEKSESGELAYSYEAEKYQVLSDGIDPLTGEEIAGVEPIYRFFNTQTGAHLYTMNEEEKEYVQENLANYNFEGIKYYAFETEPQVIETIPVYRMLNTQSGAHLFSSDLNEISYIEENLPHFSMENEGNAAFHVLEL